MDLGKWLRDRKDQAVRQWQDSVVLDAVSSGTKADNARRQVVADKERALDVGRSQAVKFQGQQFREGKIDRDKLLSNINSIVGFDTLEDQGLRKQGDLYFNTQKDNNVNTFLNNAGSAIMNAAPQRVIGGAAEYGGTLIGNEDIRDFGQKISQPYRDFGAAAQENAGNKVVATGSQVVGNLLTLPLNPAGKVGMATRFATAALPRAADTSFAIRQGGGSENAQKIGGGAVGAVSGFMNTLGGEKVLKPFTGVASKAANPLTKLLTTKLAPRVAGRVLAAGNMEGLEEVTETGVENLVAQKTFDPNRKLTDNLAQSYVLGAGMGSAVRGGVELGSMRSSTTPTQLTPEVQNKRNNLANAYTTLVDQGRPDQAAYFAREIDQIDNPAPGTLRERIRSAKERIITPLDGVGSVPIGSPLIPIPKKLQNKLGGADPLESLKAEARKYKSAEEFANAKINSYHQTDADFTKFENSFKPFTFSNAHFFSNAKPDKLVLKNLVEAYTDLKNPLMLDDGNITQPMVDKAIKDGYDGIINPNSNGTEVAVFNPDEILTRKQLTDLYNQAAQSQPPKSPLKPKPVKSDPLDVPKKDLIIRNGGGKAMSIPTNSKGDPLKKANKNKFFDYKSDGTNAVIKPEHKNRVEFYESPFYEGDLLVSVDGKYAGDLVGGAQTKNIYALRDHLERGGKLITDDEHAGLFKSDNVAMSIDPLESLKQEARTVEKFGWKSEATPQGTKLINKNGKHVATITEKKGRYTASYTDGTRIATSPDANKLAEDVARKTFYAQELPQTQNTGGTLRPDVKPTPYKNNVWQSEMSPERTAEVQSKTNNMKASMEFDKTPTPKKAYHSTASLEIEGGKLRASSDGVMGEGVYLHTDPNTAKYAGAMQADGNIADQQVLDINLKTDNLYKWADQNYPTSEQLALIKKRGYDGVYKQGGEIVVFDPNKIELSKATQSQPPKSPPVQKVEKPVESKTFVVPKTNPTDITKLSEKDLEYYGKKGYTAITDKYGNTRQITPVKTDGIQRLDSLNPTGGVSVDYSPKTRATMPLADNMTTYDKTSGKAPGEMVTIYRGAPKNQKGIVAGDFITTNQELAKSYTGDGNVLEMQVPASHILDDKTSPLGEEYLYRPPKKPFTPISQPVDNLPAVVKQVTKAKTLKAKPAAKKGVKPKGDELTPKAYANTFGITEAQAEQEITFNAATRTTKGKDANKLIEAMKSDKKLSDATRKAQESGKELNFYAKKDANGRSVGIETFNPKTHSIEAGFVVDERGNALGNHIKVDETGIQVNVGGDLVNLESIIGNPLEWGSKGTIDKTKKGRYKLSETTNRNIDNNAPTPEIANTTKRWIWSSKVKAEANLRTELDAEYTALDDRIKRTNKARPSNVSKEQYKDDIFATLNGDKTDAEIEAEYNPNAAQAILTYKKETRTLYDSLLKRINAERVKFGQEPITPRKDYITHLQEMNQNKGFVTEVYGQMKNSFADEGMGKTRNGVPGDIAGRTENFKPISKYNPFLQRREGTKSLRDPFMAVQEYLQPALYNIHMTEPGARARAVETAFRTAEQLKQMDTRSVATEMESTLKKYQNTSSDNSKLITGFQEYANAVAGKTQRFDRQVTDSSDAAAKSLKVWQGLQRIGGRGTILGNISSILAQPLNQVVGIADAGGINYAKGIAEYMGGDSQIDKSDFIRARETEATKPLRGTGEKILDAGSVPLQAVELASVKLMWHTQHQKALSEGYTGQEAVQQADMNTERLVAGRGIADKPELYRSTVANGVYQYTLEVNAQNKAFWQDLDTKQKVKFMVAASATNALMGAITGFEPLPDFLKAIFETGKDFIDPEDDRSVARKLGGGVQRMGDEYAGMNPLISGIANILPQDTRKAVFGQDSQLGRFAGGSAPIQVVKNTTNAASKVAKGDFKGAGYDAIRNVPFGNQIRKTVSGAELIARGYSTDKNGKKTFDAPTSIAGKAQVLAFGPSASKNAQGYYNGTGDKITTTDANGNTKVTKTTQSGITVNKTKNYEDAVAGIKSSYGGKYAELTEEEVKELGKTDADAKDYYKTLQAVKQSSKTPDELPTNLNPLATSIYEKEARLTTDGKDKWNKRPSANKEVNNTIKSWLPKGVDAPRITNETTKKWADYEKKKADGTLGKLEEEAVKRTILRSAYNSVLTEDEKDLYTLSKDKLLDAYDRGVINDQNIDKALKVERQLFDAGLISTETLAKKLGLVARGYKGRSGGRGGRGGSSKIAKDTSVAFSNALQSTTLKRLNSLLAGTQSGGSTSRRVATSKPVLKKISVKA